MQQYGSIKMWRLNHLTHKYIHFKVNRTNAQPKCVLFCAVGITMYVHLLGPILFLYVL
jgi:hypothetical protein